MAPAFDILNLHCDACNTKYGSKGSYIRHLVRLHEITLPKVYSESSNFDPKNRFCKTCDTKFRLKPAFSGHLRKIHHIESVHQIVTPPPSDLLPSANDRNNYCIACDKTFSMYYRYLLHLSSHRLDKMSELYQGIDCNRSNKKCLALGRYCTDC